MAFGTFTVLAGNFSQEADSHFISDNELKLRKEIDRRCWFGLVLPSYEKLPSFDIASVEVASEESAKSFAGSAVAGIAGGLLLGGVGALAGLLSGGNRNSVIFVLTLRDGRRALCKAKSKIFQIFQTAVFREANPPAATIAIDKRPRNWVMQTVTLAIVVGLLFGVASWARSFFPDGNDVALEREYIQLRGQYPTLTEPELRQKLAEQRR